MIMVNRFCSKCGRAIKQRDLPYYNTDFICHKCYHELHPLFSVEKEYKINFCRQCGNFAFGLDHTVKDYQASSLDKLKDIGNALFHAVLKQQAESKDIKFELELDKESFQQSNENYVMVTINGKLKNVESAQSTSYKTKIVLKNNLCPKCVRIRGKRFDAVVQIRILPIKDYDMKQVERTIIQYVDKINREHPTLFITELVTRTNGFDLNLSSKSLINKIRSYMNEKYDLISKYSRKLIGKDQETGRDKYRPYLLLKIVPIAVGDIVRQREKIYEILKITPNRVRLRDMKTDDLSTKRLKFFEKRNIKITE